MATARYSIPEQDASTAVLDIRLKPRNQIINDELYFFIISISMGVVCQAISVFGIVTNAINIAVFVKQGFEDKVNISLLAMAVSDLTSVLFLVWSSLCFTSVLRDTQLPFVAYEVQTISGMWPHIIFTRTTGWITAFISLERCMCVIRPLQVHTIFTRRRHIVSMLAIFAITISCSTLAYVSLGLDWKFYPDRNATLIGLVYRMDDYNRKVTDSVGFAVSGVFMPMMCFFSVLVFTVVLVVKLNQQAAWRNASSFGTESRSLNSRDQKVAKMIVSISVIFIVSYLPAVAIFIAGYVEPQLSYDGVYRNMFLVALSVSCTTEAINSSINIFVYYGMSTKYRDTFFSLTKHKANNKHFMV